MWNNDEMLICLMLLSFASGRKRRTHLDCHFRRADSPFPTLRVLLEALCRFLLARKARFHSYHYRMASFLVGKRLLMNDCDDVVITPMTATSISHFRLVFHSHTKSRAPKNNVGQQGCAATASSFLTSYNGLLW